VAVPVRTGDSVGDARTPDLRTGLNRMAGCRFCVMVRLVVAVVVLGAGSGFLAIWLGASTDLSMLATFFGALAPILIYVRRQRPDDPQGG
jgi:hypothetical protein